MDAGGLDGPFSCSEFDGPMKRLVAPMAVYIQACVMRAFVGVADDEADEPEGAANNQGGVDIVGLTWTWTLVGWLVRRGWIGTCVEELAGWITFARGEKKRVSKGHFGGEKSLHRTQRSFADVAKSRRPAQPGDHAQAIIHGLPTTKSLPMISASLRLSHHHPSSPTAPLHRLNTIVAASAQTTPAPVPVICPFW